MSSTHKEDLFTTKKRRADSNSNSFSLYGSDDEEDEVAKKKSSITMRSGDGDNNSHESSLPDTGAVKIHTTTTVPDDNDSKTAVLGHQSFLLSVYAARKGEREEMQDRHLSIDNFDSILRSFMERGDNSRKRCAFYALFDGHAGKRAADFCSDVFVRQFTAVCKKYMGETGSMSTFEKSIKKIFVDTYKSIDDEFLKEARKIKPALKDGTTATTILLLGDTVYCANIGDSRAVVCRYKQERKESVPLQITVDHNPTVFEERMRIQKAGGVVKDGRVMGILEVSRSIGDGQLKTHGIICTPDIRKLTLTSSDPFLILACDGLWKTFTPESAVQFAIDHFVKAISSTKKDDIELWTSIADEMSADAIRRGCGDNVSVILIVLLGREELKSLFGT